MKRIFSFCLLTAAVFSGSPAFAILMYGLTVTTPGYTALVGGTTVPNFNNGCSDGLTSGALSIGFTFVYDAHNYTQFQVTENGRIFLGNGVPACSDNCGSGCDGFGPSYQVQPSSGAGGGLGASVIHPTICPLWDDLGMNVAGSKVSYLTTGAVGNRVLTVEWLLIDWKYNNVNQANTSTISFQVKLYESPAGQIDFIYRQEPEALGATPTQHARIGLTGFTAGDYYSTNAAGAAPSKTVESDVAAKPANGAQFRWNFGVVLPVQLLSFKGENLGDKNLLTWETAMEANNDYFTIDRSTDAVYFEPIGKVDGAGSSSKTITYTYTDALLPGEFNTLYYRLRQTDFNGTSSGSDIISLPLREEENEPPEVYYDTHSGQLNLGFNFRDAGIYDVDISDPLGRMIYHENLFVNSKERRVLPILLPGLPAGIYVTRISGAKGTVQSKFINY
ncbi:MAG: hypothetical protein K0S33_990 [Bacteroidetes bacterium]|jgi:hypothetical protein|nr:hypothetical protein [Bacteroidota bacterium]